MSNDNADPAPAARVGFKVRVKDVRVAHQDLKTNCGVAALQNLLQVRARRDNGVLARVRALTATRHAPLVCRAVRCAGRRAEGPVG